MKIAILVPAFPPKWLAGTEIATYNIAKRLAKRGHEVHVITALDERLPKESIEEGFFVHRVSWQKVRFLGIISFWVKALLVSKKINPDIVHAQSAGISIPGFLAQKLLKKPFVVYCRGGDIYLPGRFQRIILKLVLQNADTVIALTHDMKREIQKICDRDVVVVPNGIDLKRFENLSREEACRGLQIKEDEQIILFVGRFRREKGLIYLIEAVNLIRQKTPKVKLMLVGEGPENKNLERLVRVLELEDHVGFIGQIPNEKVPKYMAAADVFVLSSLSEGFPNAILEAMASGLPIVATKVRGVPEIIKSGENGFLVEPKNPNEIAEKVLLLLRGGELRGKIAMKNREEVKKYSLESVVEKIEEVYLHLNYLQKISAPPLS